MLTMEEVNIDKYWLDMWQKWY